jgi:hypothetical protein
MQFLWCGFRLTNEERQQDPFGSPVLLPCATTECALFREEAPLCVHLFREGSDGRKVSEIRNVDVSVFLTEKPKVQ